MNPQLSTQRLKSRGCKMSSVIATIEHRWQELADIMIVCDFVDVFLDEVSCLTPSREVEFAIDMVPDTTLIPEHLITWPHLNSRNSRSSYRSCWIRCLTDRPSHLGVLLSSSSGRRRVVYNCALTTKCSTK